MINRVYIARYITINLHNQYDQNTAELEYNEDDI